MGSSDNVIPGLQQNDTLSGLCGRFGHGGRPPDYPTARLVQAARWISADCLSHGTQWRIQDPRGTCWCAHSVSGEKALYVDESCAIGIESLTGAEASPPDFLVVHSTQHAFTCRMRWEPAMLVLGENRLCVHHASNDYDDYSRERTG